MYVLGAACSQQTQIHRKLKIELNSTFVLILGLLKHHDALLSHR